MQNNKRWNLGLILILISWEISPSVWLSNSDKWGWIWLLWIVNYYERLRIYWYNSSHIEDLMRWSLGKYITKNIFESKSSENLKTKVLGNSYSFTLLKKEIDQHQFSSVQSLSHVQLFATPWIAALQASLSITRSQSSLKLMSTESAMPPSRLILCHPLLLLPPISTSIRVFSIESTLRMRWPKYWSFSFSIIPSEEIPGLISFRMLGDYRHIKIHVTYKNI